MALNPYFTQGTASEQSLIEDLIIESLKIYGKDLVYIPRTLVSKDDVLGEDRLSEFTKAYPIEMYFENVDSFAGQGAFIQKFGLMMEQSATLVVARKRWDQLIGKKGTTILPNRPAEGDLVYFPLTKGMFEIKFVQHQDPFYQIGKLYVYKLQVELFQYSSERIDTGNAAVDAFETLKTFATDTVRNPTGYVERIDVTSGGTNYTTAAATVVSAKGSGATLVPVISGGAITAINVTSGGMGYRSTDTVSITGNGNGAVAVPIVSINIDIPDSFGDNNKFKEQSQGIIFNEDNPFGDLT